ncbi:MAG: phosphate ABC transporter, permease protein PstA [Elusimicrobia bacterium RIFOXYB2_FULL_49_7]|nr:MAG: phosphate ABC transporter, permease protein PstA [Elusimicrobia bacterium RIFOXYB2_FULL_49_7]
MQNKKRIINTLVTFLTGLIAFSVIGIIILIMIIIFKGGWSHISLEFLTQAPKEGMTQGGIFPAIVGTFLLTLMMTVAGVPVGAITAIYLCEYVSETSFVTRAVRFAVNTLSGIPSIVFGLFGLGFFVQFVGSGLDQVLSPEGTLRWAQPNLLWASLTMAVLTLPVVIVSVEEAVRAVPRDLREASLALGATKWQTVWRVVLPNSYTGIMTGAILAVSRGAGEVAPILFTGAAYFLPHLPTSLSDQFMNLGYHVYIMATQSTDVDATLGIQYATTLTLLLLTFGLNFTAIFLRFHMRKKLIQS